MAKRPPGAYLIHEHFDINAIYIVDKHGSSSEKRWSVHHELEGRKAPDGVEPHFASDSLAAVLTWTAVNCVTDRRTDVRMVSTDSLITTPLLKWLWMRSKGDKCH